MMDQLPLFSILKNSRVKTILLFLGGVYVLLVAFNFFNKPKAESGIYQPSKVTLDFPDVVQPGVSFKVSWSVLAPTSRNTTSTSLYWGPVSSTSAEITLAPNKSVYPNSLPDFQQGVFSLPDTFTGRVILAEPGTYYFRAYAWVDNQHLWSEEKVLSVNP